MNIGIFTDTYKPNINGVVTSIELKKTEFEKLGHKVYIIAPLEPGYSDNDLDVIRLKSFTLIFQPEYRLAYPPSLSSLRKIRKLKLDIIQAETPFSLGMIATYIAKYEKIPLVHTYHTLFAEYVHYLGMPVVVTKKMAEKVSAIFCNVCNHIISPSYDVKNELLRYGVKKEITILPTGIDDSSFKIGDRQKVREKYNVKDDERLLLFVGRLGKEKNIDFLLEALEKLVKNEKECYKLMLVGDGPYHEELAEKVKSSIIGKSVIFAGYVNRKEISDYYKASDMFIFSSLTETQGLVILEAMASGTPVVAIKASGVEDMIENEVSGILTKNDLEEFCYKIKEIFSNEELKNKIVSNGLIKASTLSPEGTAKKLLEIYEQLVNDVQRKKIKKALRIRKYAALKVVTRIVRRHKNKN